MPRDSLAESYESERKRKIERNPMDPTVDKPGSPTVDPRVTRTKESLYEALFVLMRTTRWEKIRVKDLLDQTGMSRSTFYSHFDNKYHLLTAAIPDLTISIRGPQGRPLNLEPLFEHVDRMAEVLNPLLNQPVLFEIADIFHRNLITHWRALLEESGMACDWVLEEHLAGSLTAVVKAYVEQPVREDPADVAERFRQVLANSLDL